MADEQPASSPGTEPFVPDFDTGTHSQPFLSLGEEQAGESASRPYPDESTEEPEDLSDTVDAVELEAAGSVQSVTVPSRYTYLKWWKLVLVLLSVWIGAALVGLGLFFWWFHTIDKTLPVFVVLAYVVACTVGGLLLAMVQGRPLLTALSFAVMSGPFAAVAAAAPLYGYYYCEHMSRCLVGIIPY
ncbi:hypothetical protein [Mycobacterium sp.]|uniref:hypothetical protein n=1 Tax=Mycobacterium sp. TaxID=1785 RepID=UPI003BA9B920